MRQAEARRSSTGGAHRRPVASRLAAGIRQLLLALALVGLVLAPLSGFAHTSSMDAGASVSAMEDAPCCPHDMPDGCQDCALMASCALHCLHVGVSEAEISVLPDLPSAPAIATPERPTVGIYHVPPDRPPRAWKARRIAAGSAYSEDEQTTTILLRYSNRISIDKYCLILFLYNIDLHQCNHQIRVHFVCHIADDSNKQRRPTC